VDVATPLEFVTAFAGVQKCPLPVAANVTATPAMGTPSPSRTAAVTAMVATPFARAEAELAESDELETDGTGDAKVTDGIWAMTTPPAVALRVFASAIVEATVDDAMPLEFDTADAGAQMPPLPVEAKFTVTPAIGTPSASRTVAVALMVATPFARTDATSAASTDVELQGVRASKITDGLCAMATPPAVTLRTFVSATVEATVETATPLAFVTEVAGAQALPLPDAAKFTVTPAMGTLLASRTVTEAVTVETPFATTCTLSAVSVELVGDGVGTSAPPLPQPLAPATRQARTTESNVLECERTVPPREASFRVGPAGSRAGPGMYRTPAGDLGNPTKEGGAHP
jgi:hypothetical protein